MALTNSDRQQLRKRANQLKSTINVGREGLSEPILNMIRLAFRKADLIKVRLRAEDAAGADELARQIAASTPCELVARTGHVAVLYRSPDEAGD